MDGAPLQDYHYCNASYVIHWLDVYDRDDYCDGGADNNDDHDEEDYHDDGNDHDDKDAEGDEDDGLTSPCLGWI